MNDEDLRDLFAGLALMGLTSRGVRDGSESMVAAWCYTLSDAMIEAKYAEPEPEPEMGITAIKPKRKRSVNVSSTNS
jgi:hypothetical protein